MGVSHTVSGDIASFRTPSRVPIESLKFHFLPKQEGSGDPSPTNIRPITGWTGLNGGRSGKNIGHIVGYSAASMNSPTASRLLTNAYGTTISTRDFISPDTPLVITQEQTSSWDPTTPHSYKNGYFCVGFDNLIFDKFYDFSFKITNLTANPLNAQISDIKLNAPGGGQKTCSEIKNGNILIYRNIKWQQYYSAGNPERSTRCTLEFRNCGMSFTLSEMMVTPANKTDGVFEPYSGSAFPVTFPMDDENKFNATLKNGNIASDGKEIASSSNRLITDGFMYLPAGMYTLSSQQNYPCAIYVYSDQDENSYVSTESLTSWNNSPVVFTLTMGRYIRLKWKNNDDTKIVPSDLTNIQIKLCTFYGGGYYDPVVGEIVCSWRKFKIKDYEWTYKSGNHRFQIQLASNEKANAASAGWTNFAISDSYKQSNYAGYADLMIAGYGNNYIYIRDDRYTSETDFVEAMGEVEIAYELANPIHIPIPAQDLQAFLDHNNFWSDTNDITEVTYAVTESKDILKARKLIMAGSQPHIETASGLVAHFDTDIGAPVKELKVYFKPWQNGYGNPSPENVRSIQGHTEATIKTSGKNMLNCMRYGIPGQAANILYSIHANEEDIIDYITAAGDNDRTNLFRNLTKSSRNGLPLGTFSFNSFSDQANILPIRQDNIPSGYANAARFTAIDGGGISASRTGWFDWDINRYDQWTSWVRIQIYPNGGPGTIDTIIRPMMCHTLDRGCSFEAYHGRDYEVEFPNMLYGGYIDLVRGKIVATHGRINLKNKSWYRYTSNQFSLNTNKKLTSTSVFCDSLPISTTNGYPTDDKSLGFYSNGMNYCDILFIKYTDSNELSDFTTWLNNLEVDPCVVYELATPIEYDITPQILKTLKGTNNIWADTNGNIEVSYWTH